MKLMGAEWRDRLEHWKRVLQDDLYTSIGEIPFEACRTMDQISVEEAEKLTYEKVEPGYTWGREWEYCWFRGSVTLPECTEGQEIVLHLAPGGESTLFVDRKPFGTFRADWIINPIHYYEDNVLTWKAEKGETHEILMETYAGHFFPNAPGAPDATGPVLPGQYQDPAAEGKRRTLGVSTFGIWNEDAYQLFLDVDVLQKLMNTLDPTSLRAASIAEALEQFTLTVDFEQDRDGRIASYREARKILAPILAKTNSATTPTFFAIGHAHIDLAWLWPMAETYRKTARTFAAQLRMLEHYPDYKYIQSQPAAYEMCRTYYPDLFSSIKDAVMKGRWIPEGAMWVEPDTNMPSGEALIRQCLYGKAYFKKEFGIDSKVLWLPDTFGYTGALPQILKGCGVDYLVTQKIFWSYNEGEQFPYHYFYWEGSDGTKVTAFLPTSYNYQTDPTEIVNVWKNRVQLRNIDAFLLPFGYGDGGGGPTRDHIEYLEREKDLEGMPKVRMESPVTFFKDKEKEGGPKETYCGELYFQAHRGTYTSQARIKRNNRKAEIALHDMEMWGTAAYEKQFLEAPAYAETEVLFEDPHTTAEPLWKELLLHQFHDILPGSGIHRIYDEADKRVRAVISRADDTTAKYLDFLTDKDESAITLWNSLGFPREDVVTLPSSFAEGAVTKDGTAVPTAVLPDTGDTLALVMLPGTGALSLYPSHAATKTVEQVNVRETGPQNYELENRLIRARINKLGEITSFVLKESGREFAAEPMNRLHLYKDVPRAFDAWDIDSMYRDQELPGLTNASIRITEATPLRAALTVEGKIGNSTVRQVISLSAESQRIEFHTSIEWNELHRLLKAAFPVDVFAVNGINEMQFGYVERPTTKSRQYDKDRYEVCNHHYSALADGSHGAAVLNESKYGISMTENALELTLLRAPAAPEMRADNGHQEFTYAFIAWDGPFSKSDVVREGYALNVPIRMTTGTLTDSNDGRSLVTVDRENIIPDTVKTAEDGSGDVILRFYESKKAPCTVHVHTVWTGDVYSCDMLENEKERIASEDGSFTLSFRAFEVQTIRIHR